MTEWIEKNKKLTRCRQKRKKEKGNLQMDVKFEKPFVFEDQEYGSLTLDVENLTGKDLLDASRETRAFGDVTPLIELSKTYYAFIAAKAAKVPIELIWALPAREFSKVTVEAQNFLLE